VAAARVRAVAAAVVAAVARVQVVAAAAVVAVVAVAVAVAAAVVGDRISRSSTTSFCSAISPMVLATTASAITAAIAPMSA
jgi:hypothetical protein